MSGKEEKKSENPEKQPSKKNSKKKKDNVLYWSIGFIIAIVILFFAASKFFSREPEYETVTYNNWIFTNIEDMWWFEWQKGGNVYQVPLRFNPFDVEDVGVKGSLDSTKFNSGKNIYITFDLSNESSQNLPVLSLAAAELTQNIATAINRTPIAACVNNESYACEERPIKSCTSTDEPVIFLMEKEGEKASITLSSSCITLAGESFELIKAVDRLLYQWYGIME